MAELENTENQTPKSNKELYAERWSKANPDISMDDEEAYYGAELKNLDRREKADAADKELNDLLMSNPRNAGLLMAMKNGENPVAYLVENFGEDFKAVLDDPKKADEMAEALAKYNEKIAKDKELQEKAQANMDAMLEELDKAQEEGNFSDEDGNKAFEYLYGENGLLERLISNDIKTDDWMMIMKAANYDKQMQESREEGIVAGRNENIDINRKKKKDATNVAPDLGTGASVTPTKPMNENDEFLQKLDKRNSRFKLTGV